MRIISGKWKGRTLNVGAVTGVRPTTDRVREAVFSLLENYDIIENAVVADICAGAGSLGLEAMSRGAKHCYFIEKNKKTAATLQQTIENFAAKESANVWCGDALDCIKKLPPCDIVFADPPYNLRMTRSIMRTLEQFSAMQFGGVFVCEHGPMEYILKQPQWQLLRHKDFGNSVVDILRYSQNSDIKDS